jgi:hypothetical protein
MTIPKLKKCPNCKSDLENGYLSFLGYLKWCEDEPAEWHGFNGTLVAGKDVFTKNRNTKAIKCKQCNLIMFLPDL